MSKSGSRYGRRSNWFKIHCLLQEQNSNQNAPPGASPFTTNFLPNYLPTQNQYNGLIFGKDSKDRTSPTQEDLALQTQLLQVAMLKQEQERGNKSPHPDDLALQHQLRFLSSWQKPQDRTPPVPTTPPRDGTVSPNSYPYKTPIFPGSFVQKDTNPSDVFRPYLPSYKRAADTPSDSGTSSVESAEHNDCRSSSALSYIKNSASPTLSERDYPPRKINATLTLTTGYHPHPALGVVYQPPGLVTPSVPQHSPRGGDLLLVSPSPGGLAVEQDEPIDLSVRSTKSSSEASEPPQDEVEVKKENSDDEEEKDETPPKSAPLDLTLSIKRPAEVPLTL